MAACEPGQGGNAAAINNAIMCPGAPPRFTPPLGLNDSPRVDSGMSTARLPLLESAGDESSLRSGDT